MASELSSYHGETPTQGQGTPVAPEILAFYAHFYAVSDTNTEAAHQQYVDCFTDSATLIMGSRTARGAQEVLALRRGLWAGPVRTRRHRLHKIFPWEASNREVMLYGDVTYGLKNGRELVVEWAGRAMFEPTLLDKGVVKMTFYQVYLDSAPVADAMKD